MVGPELELHLRGVAVTYCRPVAQSGKARDSAHPQLLAIDARRQRYPEETPFRYAPLAAEADRCRWSPAARADLHDYNLEDIGI